MACCHPVLIPFFIGDVALPNDLAYEVAVCLRTAGRMEKSQKYPYNGKRLRECTLQSNEPHLMDIFDQFILPSIAMFHRRTAKTVSIPTYGAISKHRLMLTSNFTALSNLFTPTLKGYDLQSLLSLS